MTVHFFNRNRVVSLNVHLRESCKRTDMTKQE